MNAIKVATLLTAFLAPHVARATTALTFFEHSSCNAGTSFQSYNDPNALQADTSCHQLPNGTVAVYVNQIDDGCTCKFCSVLFRPQSSSCLYIFAVSVALGNTFQHRSLVRVPFILFVVVFGVSFLDRYGLFRCTS